MFWYFLCFSSTHFFFLCPCFELNFQHKSTFDRLSTGMKGRERVEALCGRECSLQYVSHPACSGLCHTVGRQRSCAELSAPSCLYLLQIFRMHGFQSLVVTLKPSGWLTLIFSKWHLHTHTHTIHRHNHRADRKSAAHWKERWLFLTGISKERKKPSSNCASATMASLWNTTLILTLNTF